MLEEAITLVAIGMAITSPVIIGVSAICPKRVAEQVKIMAKPSTVTETTVQEGSILTGAIVLASIVIALIASGLYVLGHPVRSGESSWYDVLGAKFEGLGNFVEIEVTGGRVLRGQVFSYDGTPVGLGRDIALKAPLSYYNEGGTVEPLSAHRLIVPESQIVSITVSYVP